MFEERLEKAQKIVELYKNREYRQLDVAKKLGIPVNVVGKVTRTYGYSHGKLKQSDNPDNLNEGQKIKTFIDGSKLGYLDKYEI